MTSVRDILALLRSALTGLEESGLRELPLSQPWKPAPASTPSPQVAASAPPPAPPIRAPAAPPVPPSPLASGPSILCLRCRRLAECADSKPVEETEVLVVCDLNELQDKNRELLTNMLKAIGYAAVEEPAPLASVHTAAARVLCLGNPALRALVPNSESLAVLRGLWLKTPLGRMLASYPPSYLHDNPVGKKASWADLQALVADLGLTLPPWTRSRKAS